MAVPDDDRFPESLANLWQACYHMDAYHMKTSPTMSHLQQIVFHQCSNVNQVTPQNSS